MHRPRAYAAIALHVFRGRVHVRHPARLLVLLAGIGFAACDVPTGLPKWETTFVVPSENTTISAAQFLPASVTLTEDARALAISMAPASFGEALGTLCSVCAQVLDDGAIRPAFDATFAAVLALPADVTGATLTGGSIDVVLRNGFSFDPLRSGHETGSMTITIASGATAIGRKTIDGGTHALPPAGQLQIAIPVSGVITGGLTLSIGISSPAGAAARTSTGDRLTVVATPAGITASAAQINMRARHITASPIPLNLTAIEPAVIQYVRSGAVLLEVDNPIGVSGTIDLFISHGNSVIRKPLTLTAGDSQVEVRLGADELRGMLGREVMLTLAGPVSTPASATVVPGSQLTIRSRLKLVIGPDES